MFNPSEAKGLWITLGCLVLVGTLVLVGVRKHRSAESVPVGASPNLPLEGAAILTRDTICVLRPADAVPVKRAVEASDQEVLDTFTEKRWALHLEKSVRVRYYDFRIIPGMVAVVVRSGDDFGETCYMPRDWLAP